MKATLLTIALIAVAVATSFGQGTINPLNGTLTRVKIDSNENCIWEQSDANVTTADGFQFTVLWGAAGTAPTHAVPGTMTIGTTAGILVGLPAILALDGAGDAGTVVSLKIVVVGPNGRAETDIKQVTLAPAAGPGTVIWSTTASASRFSPMMLTVCPEPSTIALGLLGLGSLLLFRRRR